MDGAKTDVRRASAKRMHRATLIVVDNGSASRHGSGRRTAGNEHWTGTRAQGNRGFPKVRFDGLNAGLRAWTADGPDGGGEGTKHVDSNSAIL